MPETILYPAPGVKLIKNILIPMRDGTRLAADLYMPHGAEATRGLEKFSVVVEYIPYRKDEVAPGARFYYTLARNGYVTARVDIRGSGGSEGVNTDEYTPQEQVDGYDVIEWLAEQPWCDGHVNMMGISYGGFSAVQVATHAPPHLTSIIPIDFTDDRYTDDCHYRGGLLRQYFDIGTYGSFMLAFNALPSYPEWSGGDWAQVWERHLADNEPYQLKWLAHQTDDAYWHHGSVKYIPDRIKCPVFMIGGWRDGYPNSPPRLYSLLNVPKKMWVGPWNHSLPDNAIPGPRVDYLREVVRWLDYWCKGIQNGIMDEPPVTVYMQHSQAPIVDRLETVGEWRAETHWPAPGLREEILYLAESGSLQASASMTGSDAYPYHPAVGVTGGLYSSALRFGLPGDQRPDEAYSLVYTTAPLAEDLHILGWARAILHLASTASVMGFAVSLCDVAPDGTSHLIAKGMLNGTHRKSHSQPESLTPDEIYELDIQIDCTAWKFEKGHRIRLNIASADWPNVWPTPELGINTLYRDDTHPSRLILPVVPAQGSAVPPMFAPSALHIDRHAVMLKPPRWQLTHDVLTGRVSVDILDSMDWRVNATTLIHREYGVVCAVDPRDPAHSSARGGALCVIERPNQRIEARSDGLLQSTATHFHLTLDLEVRVNGATHFTKRWVESIPRQLL